MRNWILRPGVVMVRALDTEESIAGGRILLPEVVRDQWTRCQAEVLDVGPPSTCTNDECRRQHVNGTHVLPSGLTTGAWIYVPPRSTLPSPVPNTYLVRVEDCWAGVTLPGASPTETG